MNQYWFTSDTHFGHSNIIRYSNRPFKDAAEMDEALINAWNSKVKPGDTVIHVGDVFFCQEDRALEIMNRLNGKKILVFGNHDKVIKRSQRLKNEFTWICDYYELSLNRDLNIVISHYPMITWNRAHYGSWMLHGHCHGTLKGAKGRIHDVGVDPNNYAPISINDLKTIMASKTFESVDHHGD